MEIYALVLLHLPSPLALGAVQLNSEAPECRVLSGVKSQPAQRGFPADRTVDGVHRQRAREEPRGICVRLGRCLGRVLERRLGGGARARGCPRGCGTESEGGRGVEEGGWRLGENERAVLREELMQAQVGGAQRRMGRQGRGRRREWEGHRGGRLGGGAGWGCCGVVGEGRGRLLLLMWLLSLPVGCARLDASGGLCAGGGDDFGGFGGVEEAATGGL